MCDNVPLQAIFKQVAMTGGPSALCFYAGSDMWGPSCPKVSAHMYWSVQRCKARSTECFRPGAPPLRLPVLLVQSGAQALGCSLLRAHQMQPDQCPANAASTVPSKCSLNSAQQMQPQQSLDHGLENHGAPILPSLGPPTPAATLKRCSTLNWLL